MLHIVPLSVSFSLFLFCTARCLSFSLSLLPSKSFSFRMRGDAIRCRRRCTAVQYVSMGSRSVESGYVELVRARACIEG
jgi:hypothetical protein